MVRTYQLHRLRTLVSIDTCVFVSIARRLKEARAERGLSMLALDKAAGITHGHTRLIESGERVDPSAETVKALARALGVTVDSLLRDDSERPIPAASAVTLSSDDAEVNSKAG